MGENSSRIAIYFGFESFKSAPHQTEAHSIKSNMNNRQSNQAEVRAAVYRNPRARKPPLSFSPANTLLIFRLLLFLILKIIADVICSGDPGKMSYRFAKQGNNLVGRSFPAEC